MFVDVRFEVAGFDLKVERMFFVLRSRGGGGGGGGGRGSGGGVGWGTGASFLT